MEQLDPKRPWIDDPSDLPSRLDWARVYIDPLGVTSRLHFTRAWTFLFFSRVVAFTVPPLVGLVFGLAGQENQNTAELPQWAFPLLVIVTSFMSYVLHRRRLLGASRRTSWAYLVFVPIVIGFVGFSAGPSEGSRDHAIAIEVQELRKQGVDNRQLAINYDRRMVYRTLARDILLGLVRQELREGLRGQVAIEAGYEAAASPTKVEEALEREGLSLTTNQKDKLNQSLQRAVRTHSSFFGKLSDFLTETNRGSMNGYAQSVQRQWRRHLPDINLSEVSERDYAFEVGTQMATAFWAIPSFLVMLWSLLWLGRLPNAKASEA